MNKRGTKKMLNGGKIFFQLTLKHSERLSADLAIKLSAAAAGMQLFLATVAHSGGLGVHMAPNR